MSTASQDALDVAPAPAAEPAAPAVPRRGLPERCYPAAGLLFLFAFAFYVATLAPDLMPGDTSDMVLAAATFREAHPPGYPLYSLLGKLFVALPVGDIPYRINLMAAFLGGLSVPLVFLALVLLTRHVMASLAGSLLFAFNYLFWTYFILAETFCLNNFFLALTAFLALLWRERCSAPVPPTPPTVGGVGGTGSCTAGRRLLVLLAFVAGLSMGNHHTMVLTFPGLLLFVAAVDRTALRPARLAALAGWFGFGLALAYAYLPVAASIHPVHHWEDTGTLRGILRLFLRAKYGTFQLASGKAPDITPMSQAYSYFGALTTQYLWPGFLLGLAGLAGVLARDRKSLLYTGGGFLLGAAFILHANIDPKPTAFDAATLQRFYQLPNFFFLLWASYGLSVVARWIEGLGGAAGNPPRARPVLVAMLLLALPAALLARNYATTSLRGNYLYPRFQQNILDTLPRNAILLAWSDTVGMGADYMAAMGRARPDVIVIKVGLVGADPYRTTVRRLYPQLTWRATNPDDSFRLGQFIHDNLPRHRIFMDGLPIKLPFPVVRRGLIFEIRPKGTVPRARDVLADNEALWKRFDLRQVNTALYPANSMCYSIVVFYYLFHRFATAMDCNHYHRYEDALRHLEACRKMDPCGYVANSTSWRRQVAFAQLGLGRVDPAIAGLDRARRDAPQESETYRLLALAYEKKGDLKKAKEYARQYYDRRKAEDAAESAPISAR